MCVSNCCFIWVKYINSGDCSIEVELLKCPLSKIGGEVGEHLFMKERCVIKDVGKNRCEGRVVRMYLCMKQKKK